MNAEALGLTIETGEAHYYSRSRQVLWHKGATSGFVQKVRELLVDDDQDCIWLRVDVSGGASCHVGYRSCFYRRVPVGSVRRASSSNGRIPRKVFDPRKSTATRRIPPSSSSRPLRRDGAFRAGVARPAAAPDRQ